MITLQTLIDELNKGTITEKEFIRRVKNYNKACRNVGRIA